MSDGQFDLELEVWVRPKNSDAMFLVGMIDATGEDRFRDGESVLAELRLAMAEVFDSLASMRQDAEKKM